MAFECNYEEVFRAFCNMTIDEMHKALKGGVSKALRKIKNKAKTNLIANYNNVTVQNPRYNDVLADNIRVSKIKTNAQGVIEGVVRAHSNGRHGSGSYRLHFLEKGTKDRYATTRNGKAIKKAYRGKINAKKFFKPAVDETLAEWDQIINEAVEKAVRKINSKK